MATNENSPAGVARGEAGLGAFRKAKGERAWVLGSATTIHIGLARAGFLKTEPAPANNVKGAQLDQLGSTIQEVRLPGTFRRPGD